MHSFILGLDITKKSNFNFFFNDFNSILHTLGSSVTGFYIFQASVKNIGSGKIQENMYFSSFVFSRKKITTRYSINTSHATGLFLQPLKRSENLWFSDVFRRHRKRPVAWDGLMPKTRNNWILLGQYIDSVVLNFLKIVCFLRILTCQFIEVSTQTTCTCSKPTMATPEKCAKSIQN